MYFGESYEYIKEQEEILQEETKRVKEFLKSEFLDDLNIKELDNNNAQRIVGKLKQEQDRKKQKYTIKSLISFIIMICTYVAGSFVMLTGPIGAAIGVTAISISAIITMIDGIIQIIESKHFAKTDFGDIANRIDKKIDQLKEKGADKKLIAKLEKLYTTISDLDTEEQLHKPSVKVNNYNYNW